MGKQKNLKVLQQYYTSVIRSVGTVSSGGSYNYMVDYASEPIVNEDSTDSKALLSCLTYLQENGFSDLYLNGKRLIGIKYGIVPLELEICFTIDDGAVSSFRMELFLRIKHNKQVVQDGTRLCGRWHWDKDCGLITDVPIDMTKVIWGIKS